MRRELEGDPLKILKPYLGHWDVPDEGDLVLTIDKIYEDEVKNQHGTEVKPIIYFMEPDAKPMILNKTNRDLGRLPADSCSLVERVGATARAELLDDMLKASVLKRGSTVRVLTEDESRVYVSTASTRFTGIYNRSLRNGNGCVFAQGAVVTKHYA